MPFASVPDAIQEIRSGHIVVVVDDEDRENEGDLTVAAEKVTPEIINFMAVRGRGLICLALTPDRCDYLRLPLMSAQNTAHYGAGRGHSKKSSSRNRHDGLPGIFPTNIKALPSVRPPGHELSRGHRRPRSAGTSARRASLPGARRISAPPACASTRECAR